MAPRTRPARFLPGLSVVLPALNEEANVAAVIADVLAVAPQVARQSEIIVVDDGSRDRTAERAEAVAARHPGQIRVVRHAANRGYGAALRSGFAAARLSYVFYMDADGQFCAADLRRLVSLLDGADVVVGYRARRADAWHRRFNAAAWNRLCRLVLGTPIRDVNCAFKLFPRAALAGVTLQAEGAMVSAELLGILLARGMRVIETAVTHRPRRLGRQTGNDVRVVVRAFVELARAGRRVRRLASGGAAVRVHASSTPATGVTPVDVRALSVPAS
jgi:glycosyltransferase involved in cell wall biosynthesis